MEKISSKDRKIFSCKYCQESKIEKFRFDRNSCCESCEFKIRKYKFYKKFPLRSKKFCKDCNEKKEYCKICELINFDLDTILPEQSGVKTYHCQYCNDNNEENFIKFRYTTCKECHNEIRREKYNSQKLKIIKLNPVPGYPEPTKGDFHEEIENLWRNFYELSQELSLELQIKNEEIQDLKEKYQSLKDEISKLK